MEVEMKYKIEIKSGQSEDFLVYAKQQSQTLDKIKSLLSESDEAIFGYSDGDAVKLDSSNIYCFFVEAGKVYAMTDEGKLQIKDRLYRLEELFSDIFVKINQSCLVNVRKIKRFDASIGGSLSVVLKNGYKDYVSRRQLKTVKERIGF